MPDKTPVSKVINSLHDGSFTLKLMRHLLDSKVMEPYMNDYVRRQVGLKSHAGALRHHSDVTMRFPLVNRWPDSLDSFENMGFLFSSHQGNFGICLMSFEEAGFLFHLAASLPGGCFGEVGRFKGGSTFLMAAASDATTSIDSYDLHVIDTLYDHQGEPYPITGEELDRELQAALERYGLSAKVNLYVGDSRAVELAKAHYDLVFIDGDHRYEGAKADFLNWKDSIKPGGHMLYHDAEQSSPLASYSPDLIDLMKEIDDSYTEEFERVGHIGTLVHFVKRTA